MCVFITAVPHYKAVRVWCVGVFITAVPVIKLHDCNLLCCLVCVIITAGPIIKLRAGGGGGQ